MTARIIGIAALCIVSAFICISCGENPAEYAETPSFLMNVQSSDVSREAAADLSDNYGTPSGVTALVPSSMPGFNKYYFDLLSEPLRYYSYAGYMCGPHGVITCTFTDIIEACNPRGIWRYTSISSQDMSSWTHECYFQLPRDEEGNIVSGPVACRNYTDQSYEFEIDFDLQAMSIDNMKVLVNEDLACDWGQSGSEVPYPAECLSDSDCAEGYICDDSNLTCIEGCLLTGCPDNAECSSYTERCAVCEDECPEGYTCGFSNNAFIPGTICMSNCESEECGDGLICAYLPATESGPQYCAVTTSNYYPVEGCDPACPEDFECMSYTPGGGSYSFCANYCETPGCPEDAYMCSYYDGECQYLIRDYNP